MDQIWDLVMKLIFIRQLLKANYEMQFVLKNDWISLLLSKWILFIYMYKDTYGSTRVSQKQVYLHSP